MRQYGYSGLLNNFTYVKMKGPNKLIETETELDHPSVDQPLGG